MVLITSPLLSGYFLALHYGHETLGFQSSKIPEGLFFIQDPGVQGISVMLQNHGNQTLYKSHP